MLRVSGLIGDTVDMALQWSSIAPALPLRASVGLGLVHCTLTSEEAMADYEAAARGVAAAHSGCASWLAPHQTAPEGLAAVLCERLTSAFDVAGVRSA